MTLTTAFLASCNGSADMGTIELDLYDTPVTCPSDVSGCTRADTGDPVSPERVRTWAFASPGSSQWAPDGLYVYFELRRPSGALAEVELDIPMTGEHQATAFSYVEYDGDRVVFRATDTRGRIEVPASVLSADCACADGRLELVFTDPGPDGLLDTDDDRVRRLSRARFAWSPDFCTTPKTMDVGGDGVEVDVVDRCVEKAPPHATTPGVTHVTPPSPESSTPAATGCDGTATSSSTGCDTSGSSSGCGGDTSSSSSGCSSSSSGCSGDTSSSSGCSGDSSSSSCSVATALAGGTRIHVHRAHPVPLRGRWLASTPAQLAIFLTAVLLYERRRVRTCP